MPMNPRLLVPRANFDPDAAAYIRAVEIADTQALEAGVKRAIDNFVRGCKADGIWSAIKASCILAGARTLAGALVPLKGSAPTNNGPFVSGDYDRKTGLVGNGTTKSLDSNYALGAALQNNCHVAAWVSTAQTSGAHAYFGASLATNVNNSRTQLVAGIGAEGNLISRCFDESSSTSATTNNVAGLQGVSRSDSASYTRRADEINQTVAVASLSGNETNMLLFRRTLSGSPLHTSGRLAFYSIGESLDLALLDTRVSALITAIGAAIP